MKRYFKSQFWGTPIDYINSAYVEISFACIMNFYLLTGLLADSSCPTST